MDALLGAPSDRYYAIPVELFRHLVHQLARPPPEPLPVAALKPPPPLKPPLKPPPKPLWLRPKEAVALYAIRTTLLYKLINEGQVVSKLIGGARVISVASLDALGDTDPQARRRGRPRKASQEARL